LPERLQESCKVLQLIQSAAVENGFSPCLFGAQRKFIVFKLANLAPKEHSRQYPNCPEAPGPVASS